MEFTVSELSGALKRVVEDAFGAVRLRGEISGYRGPHGSGHAYFALKDDKARIEAVIWRGSFGKLRFKPEEGMEVIVAGKLTTYPGSSKYQIVIESLEPAGAGALMALIEERRQRLAAEGLFDQARKKPLPFMPHAIGVITSPTGAVIRDILHRIRERFPLHVIIWPIRVQGETAGQEATLAIQGFNALAQKKDSIVPTPDVLIIARGGGSLEDLWGFNDEELLRAVAASQLPVISAIGHETDWTLLDHVADMRAPTPTAAVEMAVPVRAEFEALIASLAARISVAMNRLIAGHHQQLNALNRALPSLDQLLALPRRRHDEAAHRLSRALLAMVEKKRTLFDAGVKHLSPLPLYRQFARHSDLLLELGQRMAHNLSAVIDKKRLAAIHLVRLLATVDYRNILARGFTLVLDETGQPVRQAAFVKQGDRLTLRFVDGDIDAVADQSSPPSPASGHISRQSKSEHDRNTVKPAAADKDNKPNNKQGSLF